MIDITDANPNLDVFKFSKSHPKLSLIHTGGSGDVIWLKNGKVQERMSSMLSDHDLTFKTDEVFAEWQKSAMSRVE